MTRDRWPELCESVKEDDGLPTWEEARSWTMEKLYFWHRYLEITTNAMVGNRHFPGGLVYVDLFAGAGVCTLKNTNRRIPGSTLLAANTNKPFTRIIACEAELEFAEACRTRLRKTLVASRCHVLTGDCNKRVGDVVGLIPDRSLTLAFVDPKGLDAKFATIATLTQSRNVDLVVLLADAYDIPRNIEQHYRKAPDSKLDQVLVLRPSSIDGFVVTAFMRSRPKLDPMNRVTTNDPTCHSKIDEALGPGSRWRERLDELLNPSGANKRNLFRQIYVDQLREHLGYTHSRPKPIRCSHGPIYTLVYASKHKLGLKFWDEALKKGPSGPTLPFPD